MQGKSQPQKAKAIKFLDTKILLGTLSTAVTIGLWNMFSSSALQQENTQIPDASQSPQSSGEVMGLQPIPTLIPLLDVSELQLDGSNVQVQINANPAPALRSVMAPTQVVVQKINPVIDSAIVVSNSGGGDGGGGGNNQPAATTRSSR